jgi:hypothetical protein
MKRMLIVVLTLWLVGCSSTKVGNISASTEQAALVGNWSGTATGMAPTTGSVPIQFSFDGSNATVTVQLSASNPSCPDGQATFVLKLIPQEQLVSPPNKDASQFVEDYTGSPWGPSISNIGDGLTLYNFTGIFTSTTALSGYMVLDGGNGDNTAPSPCLPTPGNANYGYDYSYTLTKQPAQ